MAKKVSVLDAAEGATDAPPRSRRQLLKLAAAAAVGAAGGAALAPIPAAAATTGPWIELGSQATTGADSNAAAFPTKVTGIQVTFPPSFVFGPPSVLFVVDNQTSVPAGSNVDGLHALAKGTGTAGLFQAQNGFGVSAVTTSGIGVRGASTSGTGAEGASTSGIGVHGQSTSGPGIQGNGAIGGVFGSTSWDIQAAQSGRYASVGRTDIGRPIGQTSGGGAPSWNPSFVTSTLGTTFFTHELVRGNDGSIWASRFDTASASRARWKVINTLRVDSASGDGSPFAPARVINTDAAIGPVVGGIPGPLTQNSTHTWQIAGTGGIPADAIGIVGNITIVAYTSGGFATMFPAGASQPGVSSVNFAQPGVVFAWGNHYTVGFGTGANAGKISIFLSLNNPGDTAHVVVDVFGYMQ